MLQEPWFAPIGAEKAVAPVEFFTWNAAPASDPEDIKYARLEALVMKPTWLTRTNVLCASAGRAKIKRRRKTTAAPAHGKCFLTRYGYPRSIHLTPPIGTSIRPLTSKKQS